jgi:hypothetical protein
MSAIKRTNVTTRAGPIIPGMMAAAMARGMGKGKNAKVDGKAGKGGSLPRFLIMPLFSL